jgi:hypothetical protein
LDLHIGKPLIPTKLIPGPDSSDLPHTLLKVRRLFADETWILVTAGCQYGFRDVLVPFEKYVADKSYRILSEPTTYDATETKDLDYFSTLPFLNTARVQQEDKSWSDRLAYTLLSSSTRASAKICLVALSLSSRINLIALCMS